MTVEKQFKNSMRWKILLPIMVLLLLFYWWSWSWKLESLLSLNSIQALHTPSPPL